MKIIAVTNFKGGVGKTITSVSLAAVLHFVHKKRVLLIDADAQGNATKHLTEPGFKVEEHLGQAILDKNFENVVLTTPSGLDIIPADLRLGKSADVIMDLKQWSLRLKQALTTMVDHYDYVIIDCQPSVEDYTIMALVAADGYIIPSKPEKFSVLGAEVTSDVADYVVNTFNPNLKMLGIVVTQYHKNLKNSHHVEMINTLRERYGEEMMLPTIRQDKTVLDALDAWTTIFNINPESNVMKDYTALAEAVLERL